MQKGKMLKPGDTIGLISPASPSEHKSEIIRAVEYWTEKGFKVIVGKNVNKTKGFVAACEEDRAADMNEMFRRDDIDGVFVTQGGYGSAQLFSHLDFDVIKNNPKVFTGFSDITSLHIMLGKFSDLVTFHGPGLARFNSQDLTEYTEKYFHKAILSPEPIGEIPLANPEKWIYAMTQGTAEGELTGGNLTLVCATLGTPYEIETRGKILLLEEVDQEPWVMDHCLSHLRNAGKLKDIKGIVIGECHNCEPYKNNPGFLCDTGIEDVFTYYFSKLNVPVLYGLPLGHTKDIATLPLGVAVRISSDDKTLTVLESGVTA